MVSTFYRIGAGIVKRVQAFVDTTAKSGSSNHGRVE